MNPSLPSFQSFHPSLLTPNKIFIWKHNVTISFIVCLECVTWQFRAANECIAQDFSVTPTAGSIKTVLKDVSGECCMNFWDDEVSLEHRFLSQLESGSFSAVCGSWRSPLSPKEEIFIHSLTNLHVKDPIKSNSNSLIILHMTPPLKF